VSGPSKNPIVDALKAALEKHPKVDAWQIQRVLQSGHQTYLVRTELEEVRRTQSETCTAAVFVRDGDTLGRATVTLGPGDAGEAAKRVEEAVYMAGLGGDAPWQLPSPAGLPSIEAFDSAISGAEAPATARRLTDAWRAAIADAKATPSSMELFCASAETALENSAGFKAAFQSTRLSLLTIVLANANGKATESVSWEERRRAADLNVAEIVRDAATEASDLTRAELPPSGSYPVLIDARDMAALFSPVQINASGASLYQKSSRFEVGKPLPIEGSGGEPLTFITNALTPYGLSSYAFDADGVPGQRVELVKDGVFVRPWATKQFADYVGVEPTGAFANLELPTGKSSLDELRTDSGPVLHVRNFSWLTPDQARGDFASEIRVGYLYENGKRRPVKGGTVSGNLFKALGAARYASDRVFLGAYLGPAAIRLEGLSVAGA
jgi:PmbA protein